MESDVDVSEKYYIHIFLSSWGLHNNFAGGSGQDQTLQWFTHNKFLIQKKKKILKKNI